MAKPNMSKMRPRMATCGACGSERVVDAFMKRSLDSQFTARPKEATDSFYCGCQNDSELDGYHPGQGFD